MRSAEIAAVGGTTTQRTISRLEMIDERAAAEDLILMFNAGQTKQCVIPAPAFVDNEGGGCEVLTGGQRYLLIPSCCCEYRPSLSSIVIGERRFHLFTSALEGFPKFRRNGSLCCSVV